MLTIPSFMIFLTISLSGAKPSYSRKEPQKRSLVALSNQESFFNTLNELLSSFHKDLDTGVFICPGNVALHKIRTSTMLPRSLNQYLKNKIIDILQQTSSLKYRKCPLCKHSLSINESGIFSLTWPGTNLEQIRDQYEELGIHNLLLIHLAATRENMSLSLQCLDKTTFELIAAKIYKSHPLKANPDRLQDILRATQKKQRSIELVTGLGGSSFQNIDNTAEGFLTTKIGVTQQLNNERYRFSILAKYYAATQNFLGAYPINEATNSSQENTDETTTLKPFTQAVAPSLKFAIRGSRSYRRQTYWAIAAGIFATKGFIKPMVHLAVENYFGNSIAFSVGVLGFPASEITTNNQVFQIPPSSGFEVTLAYLL